MHDNEPTRRSLIVIYAILLHVTWAVSLSFDRAAANATAVHTLLNFCSDHVAVAIYFAVGGLAVIGLLYNRGIVKPLCLLPQQFILMISAGGAVRAMWLGQFADGVERSHAFLIADQAPSVIAAGLHTYAIILIAMRHDN